MSEIITAFYCVFVLFLLQSGKGELDSNVIDMDDILSEDFMPGTLLVLENPASGVKTFNESLKSLQSLDKVPDGSFGNAMETMHFHRSMMNQYLCRNFVAEQIVVDMASSRIKRRMGHISPGSETGNKSPSKFQLAMQKNLLNDEGSSSYKDWLSKSATLEDIYRHYDGAQKRVDGEISEEDEKDEDFDEEYNGHVTGYVYPQPHAGLTTAKHRGHTGLGMYYAGGDGGYPYPNAVYHHGGGGAYHVGGGLEHQHGGGAGYQHGASGGHPHGGGAGYYGGGGGGFGTHGEYQESGYAAHETGGGGHSAFDGGHAAVEDEHVYHSYPPKYHHEEGHSDKEHDLSDLFDIALTALAFLSFGMFIVHVIMCISAVNNNATTTAASMMMPMSMNPTATGQGGMTSTGNGGGGMTATGGDGTDAGTGGGATDTGGGSTGGDAPSTGGGTTSTGGGSTSTGVGSTSTGADGGGGTTSTGGGSTSTGAGAPTSTGADGGGGSTGGGTSTGGGATGSTAPGTGTGGGTTAAGDGATGTDGATATGADGGTATGEDTFKFRLRRDIPTITNPDNQALNELARRVLVSIEAALVASNDDGACLRKSVCDNNKFSRTLQGTEKIIVPMWSLGMSWLSGRLVTSKASAITMLDTLKASILGLGRANCETIYQECDLKRERAERRRRRRKRDAE